MVQLLRTTSTDNDDNLKAQALEVLNVVGNPLAKALLDRLLDSVDDDSSYKEISLRQEWFPGFINANGSAENRAALLELYGQSSLPHVFVRGKWIGGLYNDSCHR